MDLTGQPSNLPNPLAQLLGDKVGGPPLSTPRLEARPVLIIAVWDEDSRSRGVSHGKCWGSARGHFDRAQPERPPARGTDHALCGRAGFGLPASDEARAHRRSDPLSAGRPAVQASLQPHDAVLPDLRVSLYVPHIRRTSDPLSHRTPRTRAEHLPWNRTHANVDTARHG